MSVLQPAQEVFATSLAKLTGLDANVIRGWTLAEESSGAAAKRVKQGNHNWLNIGYFDSGAGKLTKNQDWNDPVRAAQATAAFLKGQKYGASSGIRKILSAAGLPPEQQIKAIATSGWASSGYGGGTNLLKTYGLVSGQPASTLPAQSPQVGLSTSLPSKPVFVHKQSGVETALDILDAKSPEAALTLYQDSKVKVRVDPIVAQTGVSPNTPDVVAEIKKYLGTPYVWGGSKPGGFDCSGLLQYVWAKKGVSIPRTTYQQIKAGKQVPINNLQPGDAVFFGSARDPHHVGMYIGHGQYVQAPHTGDVVKISNLSERNDFVQARRFA